MFNDQKGERFTQRKRKGERLECMEHHKQQKLQVAAAATSSSFSPNDLAHEPVAFKAEKQWHLMIKRLLPTSTSDTQVFWTYPLAKYVFGSHTGLIKGFKTGQLTSLIKRFTNGMSYHRHLALPWLSVSKTSLPVADNSAS